MKRFLIGFIPLVLIIAGISIQDAQAYSTGPPDNTAGNPPAFQNCTACHSSFPVNSGTGDAVITNLPATYVPGTTYNLNVLVNDPTAMRWGFEAAAMNAANQQSGTFTVTNPAVTQLSNNAGTAPDFMKQTSAGTFPGTPVSQSWQFDWTAPANGEEVLFFVAGNGANNNGSTTGDYIYTSFYSVMAAAAPGLEIDLTYVSGSPIPSGGGNLTFDVHIENIGSVPLDFDAWLETSYQGGTPTTLVLRSFTNYQPGWAINRPGMFFPVPAGYAAGNYTFSGKVGNHPDDAWDTSTFPFSKSGSADGSAFTPWVPDGTPDPFGPAQAIAGLPDRYGLKQNYPNPFNPQTNISYSLPEAGHVTVEVFNATGVKVDDLVNGYRAAGNHDAVFNAVNLPSGVYFYRLTAANYTEIRKMVLMK